MQSIAPAMTLLSPRALMELAFVSVLGACLYLAYDWCFTRGADSVQRKWDAVKAEQDAESARLVLGALATTKALQEGADTERKSKNAQIASLNTKLGIAIAGLSNRPPRPDTGSLPQSTGAGALCTGAGLYREDGEFLTREAARAKALAIQLASCEADYARVAATLK